MEFSLSYNNFEETLRLPVNPKGFKITQKNNVKAYKIVEVGDVIQINSESLASLTLDSFFPKEFGSYCSYKDIPNPYEAVETIERWRKSMKPIRLIISDTPINMAVAIESFKYGEEKGTRNINYTLTLKEYKFLKVRDLTTASSNQSRATEKEVATTYTVKSGDSLWLIAKRLKGDGANWSDIYSANKSVVGNNPNLIYPGQKLVI